MRKLCDARNFNRLSELLVGVKIQPDWIAASEQIYEGFFIKAGLSPSKKVFFICFNNSPSKVMKNVFYFILKALFVLKIFKLLSWVFGHVEKTAWLEG